MKRGVDSPADRQVAAPIRAAIHQQRVTGAASELRAALRGLQTASQATSLRPASGCRRFLQRQIDNIDTSH